jgi:hypothetical protein
MDPTRSLDRAIIRDLLTARPYLGMIFVAGRNGGVSTQTLAFWREGEPLSFSDPRLDGVPFPAGFTERAAAIDGKYVPFWVHKYEYEDYMENERIYNPRMSEHRLKDRGAPIQRFRLI